MVAAVTIFALLANCVEADWVNELRLTLANYALNKAASEPEGFHCSQKGSKARSCHCWDKDGDADIDSQGASESYCDEPKGCLMYDTKTDGSFHFDSTSKDGLHAKLDAWGVPAGMYDSFDAAALVESATFTAFDFLVHGDTASLESHVGAVRRDTDGTLYVGHVFGHADADLVQPESLNPGEIKNCHGTDRGMHERGFRDGELAEIDQGLQSYAFKKAADEASSGIAIGINV